MRLLSVLVVSLLGCSGVKSSDDSYYDVRAFVSTGSNGSDGEVQLCWTDNGTSSCHDVSSGNDDFESGSRVAYDVALDPRVKHGTKLTGFQLKYTTGLSIGDTWQVTGVRLSLWYGDKQEELVCDATFDQTLSNGATFAIPGCP